jgi:hypothetical protein
MAVGKLGSGCRAAWLLAACALVACTPSAAPALTALSTRQPLAQALLDRRREPAGQRSGAWRAHEDINGDACDRACFPRAISDCEQRPSREGRCRR